MSKDSETCDTGYVNHEEWSRVAAHTAGAWDTQLARDWKGMLEPGHGRLAVMPCWEALTFFYNKAELSEVGNQKSSTIRW